MTHHLSAWVVLLLVAVALTYARGWHRRHTSSAAGATWQLLSFYGGVSLAWLAVASPVAARAHETLTMHMAMHLALMTVAAPLILLGAPIVMLRRGLPRTLCQEVAAVLRIRLVARLGRLLAHPLFCWLVATTAVVGWHVPALFDRAETAPAVALLQRWSFLAAGLFFWWPVIRPWPSRVRAARWAVPLYLFSATLPCDALSAFLVFCDRVVYRIHPVGPHASEISALQDQEYAGALMWFCVTFVYLVPALRETLNLLAPRVRAL